MASLSSTPVVCSRVPLGHNRPSFYTKPFVHQTSFKQQYRRSTSVITAGVGDEAVSSWLDLAGFVAKNKGSRSPFEDLSSKIGSQCYIDVQGWHLYLRDVKVAPGSSVTVADALAEKLGSTIQGPGFSQSMLDELMKQVPIKLGQGKSTLALGDVMPARSLQDLAEICEKYSQGL